MKPSAKIGLLPLLFAVFFAVSGGPIGLEPLIGEVGIRFAIVLIVLIPIIYALPSAWMTAELAAAIPEEGGYYVWVTRALGPFWGFLCGFWTLMYAWVDAALYPLLAVKALAAFAQVAAGGTSFAAQMALPGVQLAIALVFVAAATVLNLAGVRAVGLTGVAFGFLLLAPFVVMVLVGAQHSLALPPVPLASGKPVGEAFQAGLVIVVWNYLGWDSVSTVAGETKNPKKDFPVALNWALILVVASYLLPVFIGWRHLPDHSQWADGAWTTIATKVGGPALGTGVFVSQVLSAAGLFMVMLLTSSRLPFVMSRNRRLPSFLSKQSGPNGVPVAAIVTSAAIVSVFVWLGTDRIEKIMLYDVLLYTAALLLEFVALAVLRVKEPALDRPFRVPGGMVGAVAIGVGPAVVMFLLVRDGLAGKGIQETFVALVLLAVAPAIYAITELMRQRGQPAP